VTPKRVTSLAVVFLLTVTLIASVVQLCGCGSSIARRIQCGWPHVLPTITDLVAVPDTVGPGEMATVTCTHRGGMQTLRFIWTASGGVVTGNEDSATSLAPDSDGTYTVTCLFGDACGGSDSRQVTITVQSP